MNIKQLVAYGLLTSTGSLALISAAAAQSLPATVKLFSGNNLGSTSFFDGFGPQSPGFTLIDYFRYNDYTSINDNNGNESARFNDPHIQSYTNVFHLSYASPLHVPGGLVGAELLLPLTGLSATTASSGQSLTDNGFGLGDITFGAFYQAFPLIRGGRPIFSWRAAIDFIAPTGGFDRSVDVNQSSGYWTFNPYFAFTALPLPLWELSGRLQYFHNFSTDRASDPPQYPGFTFENGRAGDAVEMNFATSYQLVRGFNVGLNGYVVAQIQDDTTNDVTVADSRARELYLGPGVSVKVTQADTINVNVYCPIIADNVSAGTEVNVQYIHPF